jgi:hypothetical protein
MDVYGEVVKHKKFGVGTIIESKDDFITVLFNDTQEEKKFLYPEAIGEFLELQNKISNEDMIENENSRNEQKRVNDIKNIIKREKSIKKIYGLRKK